MYNRRKDYSKKAWKELQKQNRATNGFNTGTRTHKTDKHPSRARRKEMEREEEEDMLSDKDNKIIKQLKLIFLFFDALVDLEYFL